MRSVEEHLTACLEVCAPLVAHQVPLDRALGQVLAEPVRSPVTLPPFDNSSMDGFAVRLADVPGTVPVRGDVAAGDAPSVLEPGTVARIMTGAPVPEGTEAVVQVEWTDAYGPDGVRFGLPSDTVTVNRAPAPAQNIRRAGEDVHAGDEVLAAGTVLTPRGVGLLAAVGVPEVRVVRAPRVVVLSTGSELRQPGETLEAGQIYDSNSFALVAAATRAGAVARRVKATADDPLELRATLERIAADADLVVTTGGVSAGAYDVVKQLLRDHGVEFTRVAMKPGMPQGVGRFAETPILTLPGNPVSALVSFEIFGRPMLRRMRGLPADRRRTVTGRVVAGDRTWRSPAEKVEFTRVRLHDGSIHPVGAQQSHLVADLAHANALAVVPVGTSEVTDGMVLDCYPFDEED